MHALSSRPRPLAVSPSNPASPGRSETRPLPLAAPESKGPAEGLADQVLPMPDRADPLSGPESAALIARAQQGDVAAFERLIAAYQTKVYGFARAFTTDPEQASDLAQEALIKIYRSIGGFRFQSSLLTWMFRIVKNVFLDHYKSRGQRERKLEQPIDATDEREMSGTAPAERSPEAQLLRREQQQALWVALGQVPEVFRTVLVLADMQGLSYEEIAAIVDAPIGTVKSRLNRGRDALREIIRIDRTLDRALRPDDARQKS